MVADQSSPYLQQLVDFVKKGKYDNFLFFRKRDLNESTTLSGDLGIVGDDGEDFMLEFFTEFSVEHGDFLVRRYFHPEGLLSGGLFRSPPKVHDITLGMLAKSIQIGKWDSEIIG